MPVFATAYCPDCRRRDAQHAAELAERERIIAALERRIDELHFELGKAHLRRDENDEDAKLWRNRLAHQRELKREIRQRCKACEK